MAGKPKYNTEEAVHMAAILLGQRMPKHVVRKALSSQFLPDEREINYRTFARIVSCARAQLVAGDGKSRKELRNESRQFYESAIADPMTPAVVRVRAQEALDKLYGLPITRVIHSGTGEGGAIKTESKTTVEVLAEKMKTFDFDALRSSMARAAGGPNASDN